MRKPRRRAAGGGHSGPQRHSRARWLQPVSRRVGGDGRGILGRRNSKGKEAGTCRAGTTSGEREEERLGRGRSPAMPRFEGLGLGGGLGGQVPLRSLNPCSWPGAWGGCPSGARSSQVYPAHSFDTQCLLCARYRAGPQEMALSKPGPLLPRWSAQPEPFTQEGKCVIAIITRSIRRIITRCHERQ